MALCIAFLPMTAYADWQPIEIIKTYAITGTSGAELYDSIGERGPLLGPKIRAIAHTDFKLTWTRKYEPQPDGACTITVNIPKVIITYTLPKPAAQLPASTRRSWQKFIAGVEAHERVHGGYIKDMVKEIEAMSVGFSMPDDPKCSKIRVELTKRLGEISKKERQRNVDFDKVEFSDGGNLQQLVLKLVREE
jgi:predicted secreted Zn-dependent protease